jgi:hypothetical protein
MRVTVGDIKKETLARYEEIGVGFSLFSCRSLLSGLRKREGEG